MWFGVITLFPEMFSALSAGITGRAIKHSRLSLETWNPRDFATDKHKSVDDRPYGGGPGMLMMVEPLLGAIRAAREAAISTPTLIYLSPQGKKFDQNAAAEIALKKSVIFVCGRYEGIDERIIKQEIDEEWSIGDYILTGGELAAMVIMDASIRLLPGSVGDESSIVEDSLTSGLLKHPQYTRPENLDGAKIPEVLLSGHHKKIEKWRLKHSLGKTWLKRPDLLAKKGLTEEELALLTEFMAEFLQK